MGLFEDIKNAEMVCGDEIRQLKAELATFKLRFHTLNKEYQSALDMVETLKSEQIAAEDCYREELSTAQKEICSLKRAFTVAMEELEHTQKQKAAITANRNHWKRECEAMGMLYKFTDEELQELKQEKTIQNQTLIPVKFNRIEAKNAEPLRIAAAIGK
jgi:chromosome segregation ATPase